MAQTSYENLDEPARIEAVRAARGAGTQVAHAAHELQCLEVRANLTRVDRSLDQLGTCRDEPFEEIGVQRVEGRVVGLQRVRETIPTATTNLPTIMLAEHIARELRSS